MRRAGAAAIALACLGLAWAAPPGAPGEAAPEPSHGFKAVAGLTQENLQGFGVNPAFIVAVRLADDGRILVAEHRPGQGSLLHVFQRSGSYDYPIKVPSPQLADFTIDAEGRVFLVGSLGTRFYTADLADRSSKLILSSRPDRPGFRALPPVSIMRTEDGPVVYGLFYDSKETSREVGFARIDVDGAATNLLATGDWGTRFGAALSYMPDPRLKSALVVTQGPASGAGKPPPAKPAPGPQQLLLVDASGHSREIDGADEIFGAAWSPVGSSFAYIRRREGRQELVAASPGGVPPLVLAAGTYFGPMFVDRGRSLLVAAKEPGGMSVWAMRFPSGRLERLDLPPGPCIFVAAPSGKGLAAWGPWGLRTFAL